MLFPNTNIMTHKLLTPFFLFTAALHATPVFIGTNTGGASASKGIYLADFDPTTGKLSVPELAAEYKSPGFLALHPSKPILYSCGQPTQPYADGTNSVAAFSIGSDHALKLIGETSACGKGSCHVAVDATGGTLAVANYGDGSLATVKLDADGIPTAAVTVITNNGSGPNPNRQKGPHAHGVYFSKNNDLLFEPDLGLDKIFIYPFDGATSKLGTPLPPLTCVAGSGPRHLAFSPDEKNAYIINELDNSLLATAYSNGKFSPISTTLTLPLDFTGTSTTAEIEVHANGKFVYASNRGHDSIVVYQRDGESGALKFLQRAPCGGKIPRHFKIDPSGKWLLCAHQDSNTISVLPLNDETGMLGEPTLTVPSPSPICLLFGR